MNIFIMLLTLLFMASFYMMGSPSQRVEQIETEHAVTKADMRAIAQCAAALHNAQINGIEFNDDCINKNQINSEFICLNKNLKVTQCEIVKNKKPEFSYIVTATAPVDGADYNNMMEILETYYSDAGTFGIFQGNTIESGGTSSKRIVPKAIISKMQLHDGQLVYLTQYEMPDEASNFENTAVSNIICPAGTVKTYRFGRWQCISINTKTDCGGDMVWDYDTQECIPDESRKPLCAESQTAIMVDDVWECINPFPEKSCPGNLIARLNYSTLEWECVDDPNTSVETKKCENIKVQNVYGGFGTTLLIPQSSCTDCEVMLTNTDNCTSVCVPDPAKINDARCYPSKEVKACSGPSKAFYFGFPNANYIKNVDVVSNIAVPLGKTYSQNRKFNCMDCGDTGIDEARSLPPYVVVCK